MAKKAKKDKPSDPVKPVEKKMVRVSDADHAILVELATENDRSLAAENHRALMDYFRKHGRIPPPATPT